MNCDGIAKWYRWMEYASFGGALMRCRSTLLPNIASGKRVLMAGEGDGRLLEKVLASCTEADIDYVDASFEMTKLARYRVRNQTQVRFFQADLRELKLPNAEYDVVTTPFFLDCFDQVQLTTVIDRIARAAKPRATWMVAEFARPTYGWRGWRSRAWLRLLYTVFRWTTGLRTNRLENHRPLVAQAGFTLAKEVKSCGGLLVAELWERTPSRSPRSAIAETPQAASHLLR